MDEKLLHKMVWAPKKKKKSWLRNYTKSGISLTNFFQRMEEIFDMYVKRMEAIFDMYVQ